MITTTGRNIIAKYLTGQTSSYASHIAVGCGAEPVFSNNNFDVSREELQFEMARFPITSRSIVVEEQTLFPSLAEVTGSDVKLTVPNHGYNIGQKVVISGFDTAIVDLETLSINGPNTVTAIDLDGSVHVTNAVGYPDGAVSGEYPEISANVKKVSLTAEIPTENRYVISEFGLYPSATNTYSNGSDSRTLSNFTISEKWQYFDATAESYSDIAYEPIISDANGNITITSQAFQTNADNALFDLIERVAHNEKPRFLEDAMILAGDLSNFSAPFTATGNYILLSNFRSDLSKNSTNDELRIALSWINKVAAPSTTAKALNVMLQFVTSSGNESAKYHFSISDATNLDTDGVSTNRYLVLSKKLSDGLITPDFNWRDVRSLQVYASIQNGATSLTDYSISLDAIKFENKSNTNPLYGLVGYTVTQNGLPIVKDSGTKSLVEFKIALGMGLGG